jgi:hypothetical protein
MENSRLREATRAPSVRQRGVVTAHRAEWFAKDAWVCDSESAQQSASLTSILSALRFNL